MAFQSVRACTDSGGLNLSPILTDGIGASFGMGLVEYIEIVGAGIPDRVQFVPHRLAWLARCRGRADRCLGRDLKCLCVEDDALGTCASTVPVLSMGVNACAINRVKHASDVVR